MTDDLHRRVIVHHRHLPATGDDVSQTVEVRAGRILVEPIGMGVPKGRNAAAAVYVGKFVEEAKAAGLVKSAIERAELRGAVAAPLK